MKMLLVSSHVLTLASGMVLLFVCARDSSMVMGVAGALMVFSAGFGLAMRVR